MINLNHKKLTVYQFSLDLVKEIYKLTEPFPSSENFGLISQLRRASVSIPSNIAEGSARSSLVEVDTQIEIALTLNYLNEKDIEHLSDLSNQVFAMLSKMMQ
jgi:four helix bundle protein